DRARVRDDDTRRGAVVGDGAAIDDGAVERQGVGSVYRQRRRIGEVAGQRHIVQRHIGERQRRGGRGDVTAAIDRGVLDRARARDDDTRRGAVVGDGAAVDDSAVERQRVGSVYRQ